MKDLESLCTYTDRLERYFLESKDPKEQKELKQQIRELDKEINKRMKARCSKCFM